MTSIGTHSQLALSTCALTWNDRDAMYDFFMSLKQPDGSFLVSHDAEVDVRCVYSPSSLVCLSMLAQCSGIYCLLTVATLLNILTPELLHGVPEFIASCQTYEGGFGNASFPEWAFTGQCVHLQNVSGLAVYLMCRSRQQARN